MTMRHALFWACAVVGALSVVCAFAWALPVVAFPALRPDVELQAARLACFSLVVGVALLGVAHVAQATGRVERDPRATEGE